MDKNTLKSLFLEVLNENKDTLFGDILRNNDKNLTKKTSFDVKQENNGNDCS